ncbi:hypothetical protein E2C01_064483 [Portunus trituberculatus]|uniref:Uncharacterized protein n=1 Tax=Portunus trituberculatus TaxID=210409 RepID=A0A5B7HD46_PORTR|nr:hypothetical protein [Portunus trituberculatus]
MGPVCRSLFCTCSVHRLPFNTEPFHRLLVWLSSILRPLTSLGTVPTSIAWLHICDVKSAGWRSCEVRDGNRGERAGRLLGDSADK